MKGKHTVKKPRLYKSGKIQSRFSVLKKKNGIKNRQKVTLRATWKLWRLLLQSIPDIIMTVTSDGVIQAISRTVKGLSIKETIGKKVYDYIEPNSRDMMRKTLNKVFKTGKSDVYEILGTGPNGPKSAWYETRVLPLRRGKQVTAVTLISTDITARKLVENALRDSEEKYRTLTENLNVGVYRNTPGPKGKFIEANQAIIKMFGYTSKDQFFETNVSDHYYNPDDRRRFNQKMLNDGFVRNEELYLKRQNGTPFYGSVSAVAVFDDKGIVKYYDGIIEDITERKKAEDDLKRLATIDTLTEALNRGSGLLYFDKQLKLAKRNNSKLSICYLDINGLKTINDTHGHNEGDEALKLVSQFLKEAVREGDVVARLGGDEFLLILPQCSINQMLVVCERIDKKVRAFNAKKIKPYHISLSHGIAEYNPKEDKSVEQLLAIADLEMYKKKHLKT